MNNMNIEDHQMGNPMVDMADEYEQMLMQTARILMQVARIQVERKTARVEQKTRDMIEKHRTGSLGVDKKQVQETLQKQGFRPDNLNDLKQTLSSEKHSFDEVFAMVAKTRGYDAEAVGLMREKWEQKHEEKSGLKQKVFGRFNKEEQPKIDGYDQMLDEVSKRVLETLLKNPEVVKSSESVTVQEEVTSGLPKPETYFDDLPESEKKEYVENVESLPELPDQTITDRETTPEEPVELVPGIRVKTTDWNNYGTINELNPDGKTAEVHFKNKEKGTEAIVTKNLDQLVGVPPKKADLKAVPESPRVKASEIPAAQKARKVLESSSTKIAKQTQ